MIELGAVVLSGERALMKWTMGLKIKGIEFVFSGSTHLHFGADGRSWITLIILISSDPLLRWCRCGPSNTVAVLNLDGF